MTHAPRILLLAPQSSTNATPNDASVQGAGMSTVVPPTNANSAGGDGGARQACLEPSKSAGHNSLPSPSEQAAPKRHDPLRAAGERGKVGAPPQDGGRR